MHHILTLNSGSSSIKFALFAVNGTPVEKVRGQVEGLGSMPRLKAQTGQSVLADEVLDEARVNDHASGLAAVLGFLQAHFAADTIAAVGHRIVHGGPDYTEPVVLDDARLAELEEFRPLAPLHQPHNISGVRAAKKAFPNAVQVGCFDTAFHRAHPWVNDTYALPRELYDQGVRRYGFHGLSYEYVENRLHEVAPHHADGRVIVTHLGNGSSMCAIQGGQSVGSSMGFTALDGLPMGTRCGQLDPGVVLYMMSELGMSAEEIEDVLYRRSGLKGLSGISHDMRLLEAAGTPEALQAIDYFVYRIRREIGAMIAILSGLDALVFCGGIGEHAVRIRERICQGFDWIGIELDETRNRHGSTVISSDRSRVRVFVIPTNEEAMIASHTARLMAEASSPAIG
ncbi:acetate kinase [Rhodobium orientis]|uniref:Acetate kinase n=1 Tax=Rhodobium orientis TaxID=34017 RepID=A0A327JPI6_9HYPH|nr:acetate kinase [Rhodobium orientis]MBB4303467.1 acetate kinase [Rhodobium orientis]MBK5950401.1 acetate kinase [Rhodobium orientis]RAI28369.1 acetate kinase [Rhodobium orientis]